MAALPENTRQFLRGQDGRDEDQADEDAGEIKDAMRELMSLTNNRGSQAGLPETAGAISQKAQQAQAEFFEAKKEITAETFSAGSESMHMSYFLNSFKTFNTPKSIILSTKIESQVNFQHFNKFFINFNSNYFFCFLC